MAGVKITVISNGPVRVEGEFALCDPEGREFGRETGAAVYLCRCGLSENKPFCDGKHREGGFQHEVQAR